MQGNAGTIDGVESIVKTVVEKWSKIDILIPNAGILHMKTLASTTETDFDLAFGVNVKGPYFLCQVSMTHCLSTSTTDADALSESRSVHAEWLAHRFAFNDTKSCFDCHTTISTLLLDKGGD